MHSDGLSASWAAERYAGLLARDPALLAGVLYRDHARGRDDALRACGKPGTVVAHLCGHTRGVHALRTSLRSLQLQANRADAVNLTLHASGAPARPELNAHLDAHGMMLGKEQVASVLEHVANAAKEACVSCKTIQVENGQPHQAIIAAAEDRGCDLIVMSSHGRSGLSMLLIGSVTNKVLAHAKTPVLVCP